ncbi:MAG: DnaJ domain-containing protein [Candidatus Brocadiaceae bacterium]|nr:DnaJ domain-containing protein [Candidatus Brocadiaceae bacterium]
MAGLRVDDSQFQDRLEREVRARRIARRILDVPEDAPPEELKRAWRRACKENHPDRKAGDPDAARRFAAINGAYRLLVFGEPCRMLLEADDEAPAGTDADGYNLDSRWGYFLWWRDGFFR